jgi:hypothetical protein
MLDSQRDLYRRRQEYALDDPSHGIGFDRFLLWQHDRYLSPVHRRDFAGIVITGRPSNQQRRRREEGQP